MKKTLYIIRHGQTDYNKAELVQGSGIDAPLNTTGLQQAQAFYEMYKGVAFDKIYTSALKRTHQTVAGFINKGIPWEQLSGLNEMSYGEFEGQPIFTETGPSVLDARCKWLLGQTDVRHPNGESPLDVQERQKRAMEIILKDPAETLLIAMHGRAMRILMSWTQKRDLAKMEDFDMPNSCLYKVTYYESTSNFIIELEGDIKHLESVEIE